MKDNWISVKDELPEEYSEVIICINGGSTGVAYYEPIGLICAFINDHYDELVSNEVTHWMPLPLPPKP